jgi:hypothetical protein
MMRVLRLALEGDEVNGKPLLSVDFDGTIHSYEWGWQDGTIYGTVIEGFFEWLMSVKDRYTVVVFSTRSSESDKFADMQRWLEEQYLMWRHEQNAPECLPEAVPVEFSTDKPKAHLSIDDRTIRFNGQWNAPELQADALAAFKPWTER